MIGFAVGAGVAFVIGFAVGAGSRERISRLDC